MSRHYRRFRIIHTKESIVTTIGYVVAPDADAALQRAIEKFNMTDPRVRSRIAAERCKRKRTGGDEGGRRGGNGD